MRYQNLVCRAAVRAGFRFFSVNAACRARHALMWRDAACPLLTRDYK